ncbi:hypothetical protein [Arthrobacter terrae]|nr:hypothetical protein [Arthrobacter terrae]
MSTHNVLTAVDFEIMTGEDPTDWPAQFIPGSMAKVVTNAEGIWTKIIEDNGETIRATLANNPFGDFASFGDPVEFTRANVRQVLPPTIG